MEVLEKLLLDVLYIIEHVSVCHVILKKQWNMEGKKEKLWSLLGFAFAYYVLWFTGSESRIFWTVVVFLIFRYLFGMPFSQTIAVFIVSKLFTAMLEAAVNIRPAIPLDQTDVMQITIVVIVVVWLYHFIIGRKIDDEIFQLPLPLWAVMAGILFILVLSFVLLKFIMTKIVDQEQILVMGNVLVFMAGMAVCGLMIAMAYFFHRTARYKSQKEIAENYNEQQKEYFTRLLEKEQATRQFRHDIIGHLVAVEKLCADENARKAGEYVSTLLADVSAISKAQYDVGNEIVNVIINYYFAPVMDCCEVYVNGTMGGELGIQSSDLSVLVSNMAKNAVEAVMQMPEEERKIRFKVSQGRDYLHMHMENTCTGNLLYDKKGRLKTTKDDTQNHGYGMKSIAGIAEKYEGSHEVKADDGEFAVDVFLKV